MIRSGLLWSTPTWRSSVEHSPLSSSTRSVREDRISGMIDTLLYIYKSYYYIKIAHCMVYTGNYLTSCQTILDNCEVERSTPHCYSTSSTSDACQCLPWMSLMKEPRGRYLLMHSNSQQFSQSYFRINTRDLLLYSFLVVFATLNLKKHTKIDVLNTSQDLIKSTTYGLQWPMGWRSQNFNFLLCFYGYYIVQYLAKSVKSSRIDWK